MRLKSCLKSILFVLALTFLTCPASRAAPRTKSAGPSTSPVQAPTGLDAAPRLRLSEFLGQVQEQNPEIQAARAALEASQARPSQERSLPDPSIGFMATNMSNPVPLTTVNKDRMSNAGLTFSQEIPFPGKLSLKGGIAEKEAGRQAQLLAATSLNVLSRAKQAFYDLSYAYRALDIVQENKITLQKLTHSTEARYESGEGNQADVLKAALDASLVEGELRSLEEERLRAAAEINSLLKAPPQMAVQRPEEYKPAIFSATLEELLNEAHAKNPALLSQNKVLQASLLSRDLAKRQYYPDLTFGAYYGNDGELPEMWQYRLDFKVPLYYWSKQRQGVIEAEHKVSQARSEKEASLELTNFAVQRRYAEVRASQDLMRLYGGQVQAQAQATFESSLLNYEAGKVDLLTVLSSVVAIREYRLRYEQESAKFQKALAALEELCGITLIQ